LLAERDIVIVENIVANMVKPSRPLTLYRSRIMHIELQLEAVDAGLETMARVLAATGKPNASIATTLSLSPKSYPTLQLPVKQSTNLINRTRRNNAEYALIALYTAFGEYCRNLLKELYKTKPFLVVGKAPGSVQYHEIVKLGSYDAIADYMVEQVFKKLEGLRSTTKQLTAVLDGTGVTLSDTVIHKAMMFFEIRHLLVHRSGRIDQSFLDQYASDVGTPLKLKGRLPITVGFALKGIRSVNELLEEMDSQLIMGGLLLAVSPQVRS
jgi:hypothetical protein